MGEGDGADLVQRSLKRPWPGEETAEVIITAKTYPTPARPTAKLCVAGVHLDRGARVDPPLPCQVPQCRGNLVDVFALLAAETDPADEISVTQVTTAERSEYERRLLTLNDIKDSAAVSGITFDVAWDESIRDRSIRSDEGWKMLLGRGLDIFRRGSGSQYDFVVRRQTFRPVVSFGVTYIREGEGS